VEVTLSAHSRFRTGTKCAPLARPGPARSRHARRVRENPYRVRVFADSRGRPLPLRACPQAVRSGEPAAIAGGGLEQGGGQVADPRGPPASAAFGRLFGRAPADPAGGTLDGCRARLRSRSPSQPLVGCGTLGDPAEREDADRRDRHTSQPLLGPHLPPLLPRASRRAERQGRDPGDFGASDDLRPRRHRLSRRSGRDDPRGRIPGALGSALALGPARPLPGQTRLAEPSLCFAAHHRRASRPQAQQVGGALRAFPAPPQAAAPPLQRLDRPRVQALPSRLPLAEAPPDRRARRLGGAQEQKRLPGRSRSRPGSQSRRLLSDPPHLEAVGRRSGGGRGGSAGAADPTYPSLPSGR
jgi:hypothetical protein